MMLITVAMMEISLDPREEKTVWNIPWMKPPDHIELSE